jgi:hypothetical protein
MDLPTALAAVTAGQMILLEPGTYDIAYTEGSSNTLELSKSGQSGAPIMVVAAQCGAAWEAGSGRAVLATVWYEPPTRPLQR